MLWWKVKTIVACKIHDKRNINIFVHVSHLNMLAFLYCVKLSLPFRHQISSELFTDYNKFWNRGKRMRANICEYMWARNWLRWLPESIFIHSQFGPENIPVRLELKCTIFVEIPVKMSSTNCRTVCLRPTLFMLDIASVYSVEFTI